LPLKEVRNWKLEPHQLTFDSNNIIYVTFKSLKFDIRTGSLILFQVITDAPHTSQSYAGKIHASTPGGQPREIWCFCDQVSRFWNAPDWTAEIYKVVDKVRENTMDSLDHKMLSCLSHAKVSWLSEYVHCT
jgi:hypothetical protein